MTRSFAPRLAAVATLSLLTAACAGDGYYLQAASGHLELMGDRQEIAGLLADETTPPDLRQQLALVNEALTYAAETLKLPDNGSYRDYVDLDRPFVTWNVVAAPPLSLDPVEWCFPVVGCVSYRGYFDRDEAIAFAEDLRAEGYDVSVSGARAYSTLGIFRDPVPSTIIFDAPYDLVGTIFHELAHQRVYVEGDAAFNESYAVAVERAGVEQWLAERASPQLAAAYRTDNRRREQFLALLLDARTDLGTLYATDIGDAGKLEGKAIIIDGLRQDYERLKQSWGGYSGFDGWFASEINNARLALIATYNSGVAAFDAVRAANGGDWAAFHAAVEAYAALPRAERNALLFAQPIAVAP